MIKYLIVLFILCFSFVAHADAKEIRNFYYKLECCARPPRTNKDFRKVGKYVDIIGKSVFLDKKEAKQNAISLCNTYYTTKKCKIAWCKIIRKQYTKYYNNIDLRHYKK